MERYESPSVFSCHSLKGENAMYKVLVIDDEVPIREWLEFCINRMDGYEIAGTASNGAE